MHKHHTNWYFELGITATIYYIYPGYAGCMEVWNVAGVPSVKVDTGTE